MSVCFTALALLMLDLARANVVGCDDGPPPLVQLLGMAGLYVEGGDDSAGSGFPSEAGGSRRHGRYRALHGALRWRWRVLRVHQLRLTVVDPLPNQLCLAKFIFILRSTVVGPDFALEHHWMMAMVVLPLFIVEGGGCEDWFRPEIRLGQLRYRSGFAAAVSDAATAAVPAAAAVVAGWMVEVSSVGRLVASAAGDGGVSACSESLQPSAEELPGVGM